MDLLSTVEQKLKAQFPEGFVSSEMIADYPTFIVKRETIIDVVKFLYNEEELAFPLCLPSWPS